MENIPTTVVTFTPALLQGLLDTLKQRRINYVLVLNPGSLPRDVKIKNLLAFFGAPLPHNLQAFAGKYGHDLSTDLKALVILEILKSFKGADFLIFDNFLAGLSDRFAFNFTNALKQLQQGRKLAFFTNSVAVISKIRGNIIKKTDEEQPY